METPKDPVMLMSFINTRLRDSGIELAELCEDIGLPREELERQLSAAGFCYHKEIRQFR